MFSVIIPTKNEEKFIGRLLQSIRDQDIQPDKIVVADKSSDRTAEIARSYGAEVIEGVDDGHIGRGRNSGARLVNSEVIFFIDADVIIPPGFFVKALEIFKKKKLDIATSYLKADRKRLVSTVYFAGWNAIKRFGSVTRRVIADSGVCLMVTREFFDKVGGFDEAMTVGEDSDFIRRVVKADGWFKVLPLSVVTSDRRFSKPPHKMAWQLLGLGGMLALTIIGVKLLQKSSYLKKSWGTFEKMYGELGGEKPVAVKD